MSRKTFVWVGIVVTLVLAGVVSFYASSSPDGLEKVATDEGFIDRAEDSDTAGSPLADYGTSGVEDERLSVGIAGVIGVFATFAAAGGIFWLVARKNPERGSDSGAPGREPVDTRN
jgi:cobalt/nickel transport protein